MDEPDIPIPVVLWLRFRKRYIELEVGELFFDIPEVVNVEQLSQTTSAVPVRNLAASLLAFEEFKDVTSQRSHAGTTTDVHHLGLAILDEELTVRTTDGRLVTWFQTEDPATHLSWRNVWQPWWRTRNPDVQHDDAFFTGIISH